METAGPASSSPGGVARIGRESDDDDDDNGGDGNGAESSLELAVRRLEQASLADADAHIGMADSKKKNNGRRK